ncbi:MAG: glutamate racemase [Actinomycetota bacterium]|nr:glutamate racemase [Actinomycetota bacterium]
MDSRPIGVFDSGVGGLTVLREILKVVPDEDIIYFGDTARVPYGPRDLEEVRRFVFKITKFLSEKDVKLIVIACNTSTAAALDQLNNRYGIPIIGVIEPGARTAVITTSNRKVGVIATRGTVESGAYRQAIHKIDKGIEVYSAAAPRLVEYVEEGILSGPQLNRAICGYIEPLLLKDIDVLIMGCTHFPLIEGPIARCAGKRVKVISSAVETAGDVSKVLKQYDMAAPRDRKSTRLFYETGYGSHFFEVGRMFLGEDIKDVISINLEL